MKFYNMRGVICATITTVLFSAASSSADSLVIGAGYADFSNDLADDASLVTLEYHSNPFFQKGRFSLSYGGAISVHDNGDFFAGVGLSAIRTIGDSWFVEGSIFPGYFNENEPNNDLGSDFEIRSLLGVGYNLKSGNQISLAISHKSNADVGDINPGLNAVQIRYRHNF